MVAAVKVRNPFGVFFSIFFLKILNIKVIYGNLTELSSYEAIDALPPPQAGEGPIFHNIKAAMYIYLSCSAWSKIKFILFH